MTGYVYLLGNEAMPGLFKIGFTFGHPEARAAELSRHSAVPRPFDLLCFTLTKDPRALERRLHLFFDDDRVSSVREFFLFDGSGRCNVPDLAATEMIRADALLYMVMPLADRYFVGGAETRISLVELAEKTLLH